MTEFLRENPTWCQLTQARIREALSTSDLVTLWEDELKNRNLETDLRISLCAERSSNYTMPLHRELV